MGCHVLLQGIFPIQGLNPGLPHCRQFLYRRSHQGSLKVKVFIAQSCLTLCKSMDCSPPGSSVHGILQARILEWIAIPFSRGSSWPRNQTGVSCILKESACNAGDPGSSLDIKAPLEARAWVKKLEEKLRLEKDMELSITLKFGAIGQDGRVGQ